MGRGTLVSTGPKGGHFPLTLNFFINSYILLVYKFSYINSYVNSYINSYVSPPASYIYVRNARKTGMKRNLNFSRTEILVLPHLTKENAITTDITRDIHRKFSKFLRELDELDGEKDKIREKVPKESTLRAALISLHNPKGVLRRSYIKVKNRKKPVLVYRIKKEYEQLPSIFENFFETLLTFESERVLNNIDFEILHACSIGFISDVEARSETSEDTDVGLDKIEIRIKKLVSLDLLDGTTKPGYYKTTKLGKQLLKVLNYKSNGTEENKNPKNNVQKILNNTT